jgi:hypothetical protein
MEESKEEQWGWLSLLGTGAASVLVVLMCWFTDRWRRLSSRERLALRILMEYRLKLARKAVVSAIWSSSATASKLYNRRFVSAPQVDFRPPDFSVE